MINCPVRAVSGPRRLTNGALSRNEGVHGRVWRFGGVGAISGGGAHVGGSVRRARDR